MRKIKKFRIPLYHYDIYRKAKKLGYDIDGSHFAGQQGLKEFTCVLSSSIEPCAVFDTIEADSPYWMRLNIENKQTAATLGFLSFFGQFSHKVSSLEDEFEKKCASLISHCISSYCVSMVSELAQEEAKNEGLILSKPYFAYIWEKEGFVSVCLDRKYMLDFEIELVKELLTRLEATKYGLNLSEDIKPYHTCVFTIPWIAPRKK